MDDRRIREIAERAMKEIPLPPAFRADAKSAIESAIRVALAESWAEAPSEAMHIAAMKAKIGTTPFWVYCADAHLPEGIPSAIFRAMAAVRAREFKPPEGGA